MEELEAEAWTILVHHCGYELAEAPGLMKARGELDHRPAALGIENAFPEAKPGLELRER